VCYFVLINPYLILNAPDALIFVLPPTTPPALNHWNTKFKNSRTTSWSLLLLVKNNFTLSNISELTYPPFDSGATFAPELFTDTWCWNSATFGTFCVAFFNVT
jgi:hypothetical protein